MTSPEVEAAAEQEGEEQGDSPSAGKDITGSTKAITGRHRQTRDHLAFLNEPTESRSLRQHITQSKDW